MLIAFAVATLATHFAFTDRSLAGQSAQPAAGTEVEKASARLLSARFFAFGGIGLTGAPAEEERAFHTIAARPNALELFETILAKANGEGQLYALCGIRKLAPEQFGAAARPVILANATVTTMSGCVAWEEQASNIVARIAGGIYDFEMK